MNLDHQTYNVNNMSVLAVLTLYIYIDSADTLCLEIKTLWRMKI
jgi:hypothetical protein